tara:strand:- start:1330 stop:1878 length:549 start_codon:yes stop_codon:yes gene_type:complete
MSEYEKLNGGMRFAPDPQWIKNSFNHHWMGLCHLISCLNIQHGKMIEIGSYAGESTAMFASSGRFISIDTIDPYYWSGSHEVEMEYRVNTRHWDYIKQHKYYSQDIYNKFDNDKYDFVYIDGDHSGENVARDIEQYFPKVKKGGYIGGHDYSKNHWPDVVDAVNKVFPVVDTFADTSWLCQK